MDDNKLEELKIKADQGDFNSCVDYAVEIYNRFKEDNKQKEEDTKVAFLYIMMGTERPNDLDNNHKKLCITYLKTIYKDAYRFNITNEDVSDTVFNNLEEKLHFNNWGGNSYKIDKSFIDEEKNKIVVAQKAIDKEFYSTDNVKEIPDLLKSVKNEIDYFVEKLSNIFNTSVDKEIVDHLRNVNIVFSYKKEKDIYAPSKDDILSLLKNLLKECKKNIGKVEPEVLERLNDLIKKVEQDDELDVNSISSSVQNLGIHDDNSELYKLVSNIYRALEISTFYTNGTYNDGTNTITLYLSNIYDKAKEIKVRPEYYLISVFAHELFHAYHYKMITTSFMQDEKSKIVIESLASYFQFTYLFDRYGIFDEKLYKLTKENDLVARNIYDSWDIDMYLYPYSGAKYMFYSNKCLEKRCNNNMFKKVFNYSLTSINKAFEMIKLFYDICE